MRQALPGAILQELVHKRSRVRLDGVEQPVTFPDRTTDGDLAPDDIEDPLLVDAEPRVLLEDGGQRSPALEAHLEAEVVESEQDAVDCTLRHAHGEHAREPPARGKWLIGIEQRVDELAHAFFGHLAQRAHGILGDGIPRQQRNDVRDERRLQPFIRSQDMKHRVTIRAIAEPESLALPDRPRWGPVPSSSRCWSSLQAGATGSAAAVDGSFAS